MKVSKVYEVLAGWDSGGTFELQHNLYGNKGSMARPGWLEHPTYCFVGSRSIQLSYGRPEKFLASRSLSAFAYPVNRLPRRGKGIFR